MSSNFNDISKETHMIREHKASPNVVPQDLDGVTLPNPDSDALPEDQISSAPPEEVEEPQQQDEPSGSSIRTRCQKVSFKLFLYRGGQAYVLEMQELETGQNNAYRLSLCQNEEKWTIETKKISFQQHDDVHPVEQIPNPPFQPKYTLSLQDRLEGWIVEERRRSGSKLVDKFYIHERVSRNFRSLKEVAPFILYSCRKEDINLAKENQETVKAFLSESYSNFYKYYAEDDQGESSDATISDTNSARTGPDADHIMRDATTEATPSRQEDDKPSEVEEEDHEVFSFALDNPIAKV